MTGTIPSVAPPAAEPVDHTYHINIRVHNPSDLGLDLHIKHLYKSYLEKNVPLQYCPNVLQEEKLHRNVSA